MLKSLLAKLAFRHVVGLYLGEHEVAVSKVAATPLGPVLIASSTEPCTPENLPSVLERLVVPLLGRKRRVPVVVGLPNSRLFFGTRLTHSGAELTPEVVMQKALYSPNIRVDELTIELMKGNVNKSAVLSMAACRKKYLAGIIGTLSELGVRLLRAEPCCCALVRLAGQQHPARRSKVLLRVFLNAGQGLVAVIAGGLPMAWRTFVLPPGSEGGAILSAVRTLQTQATNYGVESSPEYVAIHGRADLHERLRQEGFPTEMGIRINWYEGPSFDGPTMAFSLALGGLIQNLTAVDLARAMKPRASLREIFPWGELVFEATMVACVGMVLGLHAVQLDEACEHVWAQGSRYKGLASAEVPKLATEKKDLQDRIEATHKFLKSRIMWTDYTSDVANCLPANAFLTAFRGENYLVCDSKNKISSTAERKSLLLKATAPYPQNGIMPREIDNFLGALRTDAVIKHDFSTVALADITRVEPRTRDKSLIASFAIVCLDKAAKNAPAVPKDNGNKEAH